MDYFIVKNNGRVYQNGNGISTQKELKRNMMAGGNIICDLYKKDVYFVPTGLDAGISWGKVISVAPKEITIATIPDITLAILKDYNTDYTKLKSDLFGLYNKSDLKIMKKISESTNIDQLNKIAQLDEKTKESRDINALIEPLYEYIENNNILNNNKILNYLIKKIKDLKIIFINRKLNKCVINCYKLLQQTSKSNEDVAKIREYYDYVMKNIVYLTNEQLKKVQERFRKLRYEEHPDQETDAEMTKTIKIAYIEKILKDYPKLATRKVLADFEIYKTNFIYCEIPDSINTL